MNTGELIRCYHCDGAITWEPVIWCDICGYRAGGWDDIFEKHHFCYRHKEPEIRSFLSGLQEFIEKC